MPAAPTSLGGDGIARDGRALLATRRDRLQAVLCVGDAIALLIGFVVPLMFVAEVGPRNMLVGLGESAVIVTAGLWALRWQECWSPRVTGVRALEVSRLSRSLVLVGIFCLVFDRKSSMSIRVADLVIATVTAWVVLVMWRSLYRAYLASERRNDRLISRVVIVGTDRRAGELHKLFGMHPELGHRTVAVIGDRNEAVARGLGNLWAGELIDAGSLIEGLRADEVILCTADLDPAMVNQLTVTARQGKRLVYVDPGLGRVDFRRMQPTAVAHQAFFEVEPAHLNRGQLIAKRIFDVGVSLFVAILAAPVMVGAALAIKLGDGGPVLFKQTRVGQNGKEFGIYKFRTMVVDAEARLAALEAANQRSDHLFKMERDPRVTRVGQLLRSTSLDELPQLFNVLRGHMSLVGPRPALPKEVAGFPAGLKARELVRPGITGLWQSEARDNPHFAAYERLDLHYVENWSLSLDAMILLATVDHLVLRPVFKRFAREPVVAEA